ncbi:hypothetical protein WA538_005239 [Blastocystis sp. DL]
MDDVETGNLGFQPLFDSSDIGKKKAEVAMQKCYGTTNSPNHRCFLCSVQRMDLSQLTSYDAIFGCVDNLEARFYINSVVLQCKDKTIVYIDGGSMGLGGQAQLIIPHVTPCFRCLSSLFPDPETELYPLCTIVSHPTLPEHCITYAKQILWEKERPNELFDPDALDCIRWTMEWATERGRQFGINGITMELTKRVLHNSIITHPETNDRIAAIMIGFLQRLFVDVPLTSNYVVSLHLSTLIPSYRSDEGDYEEEFWMEKDETCPLCKQSQSSVLQISPTTQLKELVENEDVISVWKGMDLLYAAQPQSLRKRTMAHLTMSLESLGIINGDSLTFTNSSTGEEWTSQLRFAFLLS